MTTTTHVRGRTAEPPHTADLRIVGHGLTVPLVTGGALAGDRDPRASTVGPTTTDARRRDPPTLDTPNRRSPAVAGLSDTGRAERAATGMTLV